MARRIIGRRRAEHTVCVKLPGLAFGREDSIQGLRIAYSRAAGIPSLTFPCHLANFFLRLRVEQYIINGEWQINPQEPTETDHDGMTNNVFQGKCFCLF